MLECRVFILSAGRGFVKLGGTAADNVADFLGGGSVGRLVGGSAGFLGGGNFGLAALLPAEACRL